MNYLVKPAAFLIRILTEILEVCILMLSASPTRILPVEGEVECANVVNQLFLIADCSRILIWILLEIVEICIQVWLSVLKVSWNWWNVDFLILIHIGFALIVCGLRLLHSPWIYDAISWTKFTSKTPVGRVSLDPVILHNNRYKPT